jgi:hypothetical protein
MTTKLFRQEQIVKDLIKLIPNEKIDLMTRFTIGGTVRYLSYGQEWEESAEESLRAVQKYLP